MIVPTRTASQEAISSAPNSGVTPKWRTDESVLAAAAVVVVLLGGSTGAEEVGGEEGRALGLGWSLGRMMEARTVITPPERRDAGGGGLGV